MSKHKYKVPADQVLGPNRQDILVLVDKMKAKTDGLSAVSVPAPHSHVLEGDERYFLAAALALRGDHTWLLDRLYIPDATEYDNGFKCATQWIDFTGHISYPELADIQQAVNDCVAVAAVSAALTVYFTEGASMVAASQEFDSLLIECLKAKGIQLLGNFSAWITSQTYQGAWHWCT